MNNKKEIRKVASHVLLSNKYIVTCPFCSEKNIIYTDSIHSIKDNHFCKHEFLRHINGTFVFFKNREINYIDLGN